MGNNNISKQNDLKNNVDKLRKVQRVELSDSEDSEKDLKRKRKEPTKKNLIKLDELKKSNTFRMQ